MINQYSPPPSGLYPGASVWTYLRDSGGPSQEQSVDQQAQEVKAYCGWYSFALVKIFQDIARSGGSVIGRDEFISMIDLTDDKASRPKAILIWNFARFARDIDDFYFNKITLKRRGIILHSLTNPIPADDSGARFIEFGINWANEEKRRQTSRDVKRALQALVSKGFSPGAPPRGYTAVKVAIGEKRDGTPRIVSKWEPDPVLAELVKQAWQLRAQGKSYKEIGQATGGKLYTATNSWPTFFKNKGYLGIGKSGDLEVEDHHEPLITWELWEAVQKIHEAHPRQGKHGQLNHPRRVGNPTILSGLTFCIECGAMMTHSPGNRKHPWLHYICGQKDRHGAKSCNSRRVGAVNAEQQILTVVLNQVLTPDYLLDAIEETKKQLDSTAEIERQVKAITRKIEELKIAIRRNLDTIEKTGSAAAQDRLKEREAEQAQQQADLERLQLQLRTAQTEITSEAIDIILAAWRAQFDQLQESGNVRELKAWLLQFLSKIELGYNRAKIFYTYPVIDLLPRDVKYTNNVFDLQGVAKTWDKKFVMVEWSVKSGTSPND
jgi:site-specific DNA recombinase